MNILRNFKIPLLIYVFSSCNGAQFASSPKGNNSQKTTISNPDNPIELACSVAPQVLGLGEAVNINITTIETYTNNIFQKITSGNISENQELKKENKEYKLISGESNILTPTNIGVYTVDLMLIANSNSIASCTFEVKAKENINQVDSTIPTNPTNPNEIANDPRLPIGIDPTVPVCNDQQISVGAYVAFVIDNSNSNSATDCPSPVKNGTFGGVDTYECQEMTNREKAVNQAFATLAHVAETSQTDEAISMISIASFPTKENYSTGWKDQSNGWISSNLENQNEISLSMEFSRTPFGLTPYNAAFDAATDLFSSVSSDNRAKIMVLVTDGEATDRNPILVSTKADELRALGVEVITVFVTGTESKAARKAKHANMLNNFNDRSINDGYGPWHDSVISDFDSYIELINGSVNTPGLVQEISSQVDEGCSGDSCQKLVIEVQDSASLDNVFSNIIRTRAIKCQ